MIFARHIVPLVTAVLLCAVQTVNADTFRLPPRNTQVPMAEIEAICRYYGLSKLWETIQSKPPESPFSSDGCSMWPDHWFEGQDLYEACFIHDLQYWSGLPGDDMGRLRADVALMLWVAENVSIDLAEAMFNGVRVGGSEKFETPWRWGFGRSRPQAKTND